MVRCLYTLLYYLLLPFILLRLFLRARKAPAYRRRIAERFGCFPVSELHHPIWVHSVSVGETIAAAPLIRQLQARFPERSIVVTTMTPTGSERVRALFGDTVFHVYAPYDYPGAIRRFLDKVQPSLLVIMETELWPNLIHYCHTQAVPVVLANARLSEKSARGYERFSALTGPMLRQLTKVVTQTAADAERFKRLGLPEENIAISGSIKFDIDLDESLKQQAASLKQNWGEQRKVWIAASTHDGEDGIILQAHSRLLETFPDLLLVLVPRHPERFNAVAELIKQRGFNVQRRSEKQSISSDTQVVLGDTMGELLLLLGAADIAFVGGSLVDKGGHNMLEPAAWGLPIITGKSDFNFAEISEKLQQQGGLVTVAGVSRFTEQMMAWLESDTARKGAGAAAARVVGENRGALEKLVRAVCHWV